MKLLGILLIVAGLLLFVFSKLRYRAEEQILNNYPSQISVKTISLPHWPTFAGLGFTGLGVIYVSVGRNKRNLIEP